MHKEIEKKYLIWENEVDYSTDNLLGLFLSVESLRKFVLKRGKPLKQGFLPKNRGWDLVKRLGLKPGFKPHVFRLRDFSGKKYFTIKGKGLVERDEVEKEISSSIFRFYWPFTKGKRVEKIRLKIAYGYHNMEIDIFTDRDLILAEIEVKENKELSKLKPVGMDITKVTKYQNINLAK